jgi:putative ABC transport system permease protein
MFRNHLTIAWRNLLRHKTFSLINILGLTLGLATLCYIMVYINHEASYDTYHTQADRTYRVLQIDTTADGPRPGVAIFSPLAPVFRERVPEIEKLARVEIPREAVFTYQNEYFSEKGFLWADAELLEIFDLPMLYGNPKQALKQPNSLIITQKTALKYFAKSNVLGEVLQLDTIPMIVTGVIEDLPTNTHLQFSILGSYSTLGEAKDPWKHQGSMYILAKKYTSPQIISSKLTREAKEASWWLRYPLPLVLQPLREVHLYSSDFLSPIQGNDIKYLFIFGAVAIIIALSTTFNYVNMATARFAHRAKEVGVRKVIGADRWSLIGQFLAESVLFSVIAMLLALTLIQVFLPHINRVLEVNFTRQYMQQPFILVIFLGLSIIMGVMAGIYPAVFLSHFQPKQILKGTGKIKGNWHLREALIILQFFITSALVISTFIVRQQLQYISTKKLGFQKEQILVLTTPKNFKDKLPLAKQRLISIPGVESVAGTISSPLEGGFKSVEEIKGIKWNVAHINADVHFVKTLGMQIIQGRDFSEEIKRDAKEGVLVNETLVKAYRWQDPIGQILKMSENRKIIGVVKDFHTGSLHEPILPAMITADPDFFFPHRMLFVRMQTTDVVHTVKAIEDAWKRFAPNLRLLFPFWMTSIRQCIRVKYVFVT